MKRRRAAPIALALALLLAFAVCAVLTLASGALFYRRLNAALEGGFIKRGALSYIETKLRSYDAKGAVRLQSFGGGPAICLYETIDNTAYLTRIYCFDGWLMELYCPQELELLPSAGQRLLEIPALEADMLENGIIKIRVPGGDGEIFYYPRSQNSQKEERP